MLVYIRFRFRQWRFGGAALLGVLHDVLIVIAFYAIFNITINNPFIAGILTVVGYSINDTIVVFDRIRENLRLKRSMQLDLLIDQSITQTLGRSLMTSITTLIVMVPMLIMSGPAIREFVVPLMVGIIAGAYSSIAMCSPLYYEFSKRKKVSKYEKQVQAATKKSKKKAKKQLEETKALPDAEIGKPADDTADLTAKNAPKDNNAADPAKSGTDALQPKQKNTMDQKRSKRYVKGNQKK